MNNLSTRHCEPMFFGVAVSPKVREIASTVKLSRNDREERKEDDGRES